MHQENQHTHQRNNQSRSRSSQPVQAKTPAAIRKKPNATGMPDGVKDKMESNFGADFSDVKVHATSDEAKNIGALAYAQGNNVHFAPGQFKPDTRSGQELLGHELAHVIQQRQGRVAATTQAKGIPVNDSPALEHEADVAGAKAASGQAVGQAKRDQSPSPSGKIRQHQDQEDMTDADRIIRLLSYSLTDLIVSEREETRIISILRNTSSLNSTIREINNREMLEALIDRVNGNDKRHSLMQILGAGLNRANRALVEPFIHQLGTQWEMQYFIAKAGVSGAASPFNPASYNDLISNDPTEPFTGSGATGVNPTELSAIPVMDQLAMVRGDATVKERYSNPLNPDYQGSGATSRYAEVFRMPDNDRERQAELLLRRQISSIFTDSYGGNLPSRTQVIRAAGNRYNLEPELIGAVLLTEQRDQSQNEDRVDYQSADSMIDKNTSIGLGQVVVTTAQRNDLFSGLLTQSRRREINNDHDDTARLLTSDEFNIFATAKYIRQVANAGANLSRGSLPVTEATYSQIDYSKFSMNSSAWPMDNKKALASEYTSSPWDDRLVTLWGDMVELAYNDIKRTGIF